VPVVLRQYEDGLDELIGDSYVNSVEGVMDGQAADQISNGTNDLTEFKIK